MQQMDTSLRSLRAKLRQRDELLGELVSKRTAAVEHAELNDAALSRVLTMMDSSDPGRGTLAEQLNTCISVAYKTICCFCSVARVLIVKYSAYHIDFYRLEACAQRRRRGGVP